MPEGLPDRETETPPEPVPSDPISSLATDLDQRILGLDRMLAEIQDHFAANRFEEGQVEILSYKHNLEALASDLTTFSQQDEVRANTITLQFNATVSVHTEILLQLMNQIPDVSRPFIEQALNALDTNRQVLSDLFPEGIPIGPPDGLPDGPPDGIPTGRP